MKESKGKGGNKKKTTGRVKDLGEALVSL